MMDKHDRDWALTVGLLAIHQAEEVLVSCEDWLDRVGTSGSPWLVNPRAASGDSWVSTKLAPGRRPSSGTQ